MRNDVVRFGVVLALICIVAAGVLAYVNDITEEKIAAQKALEEERALSEALPGASDFKDKTGEVQDVLARPEFGLIKGYYVGYSGGAPVGAAIKFSSPGYGGAIDGIVGISAEGKVTGLMILGQQETPGLGANVSTKSFRERFVGKDASGPIKLKKDGGDIVAITGATISSRAVTRGVSSATQFFSAVFAR